MRSNSFTIKMSKKSNTELEHIFENKNEYTGEAVQAVIWELENRNLIEKTETPYIDASIITSLEKETEEDLEKNESPFETLILPLLYSKKTILGFTIFFSTLFGVILLMSNLKKMNKPKARIEVLLFGIVYTILSALLLNSLPPMFFISILFNLIGYTVLIEYFWNKNLGKNLEHKKKQIQKPLLISILVTLAFVFLLVSTGNYSQ